MPKAKPTADTVSLSTLKLNPNNPRIIKDHRFRALCKSLSEFSKGMELKPIIVDDTNMILAGNMRYRALQELGHKEVPASWVRKADQLTDIEKKRFVLIDNEAFGETDFEILANEWDLELATDWGISIPGFGGTLEEHAERQERVNNEILQYNIVFNDQSEYERFIAWVRKLKNATSDPDATISQLILEAIGE